MLGVLDEFASHLPKPPLNLLMEALDKRQSMKEAEVSVDSVPQYLTNW